jgi:hypothetical protein
MFRVIEKVFGIEEEWEQCLGEFATEEEAFTVCEQWEQTARWVFVRNMQEYD